MEKSQIRFSNFPICNLKENIIGMLSILPNLFIFQADGMDVKKKICEEIMARNNNEKDRQRQIKSLSHFKAGLRISR